MFRVSAKKFLYWDHKVGEEKEHKHVWHIGVIVESESLNEKGYVLDFNEITGAIEECLKVGEVNSFSELKEFKTSNSTAETIARFVFLKLRFREWSRSDVKVVSVTVLKDLKDFAEYTEH